MLLFSNQSDFKQSLLDPRTKIALLLVINALAFMYTDRRLVMWMLAAVIVLLFTVEGLYRQAVTLITVCFVVVGATVALEQMPGFGSTVATLLVFVFMYIPPLAIGVYVIKTTTVSELVVAAKGAKIPDEITIPLAVTLRFFPAVFTELKAVYTAMRLTSGLSGGILLNPYRFAELLMIPVIASVLRIGETLSASALIRGLGSPGAKTSITRVGFTWCDLVGVLVMIAMIVIAVLLGS